MEYNYTHGGDVYRNPIEYDFSINVNPLGMPLASIQAAHEGIVLTGRYPDYRAEQLCHAIAKAKNIPADRIIPGNGAAELLYVLGQTIPGKALVIAPTFTGYAEAVAAGGGEITYAGWMADDSEGKQTADELAQETVLPKNAENKYDSEIYRLNSPVLEISSNDIRRRIRDGESIRYLLPAKVADYIYEHGLYQPDIRDEAPSQNTSSL